MKGKTKLWLAAIFALVLAARLFVAFQTEGLDYEAYSVLRQVESVHDTGKPLFNDELSYSGRIQIYSPVYSYFLASFSFFISIELVAKIIPNILASLTVLVIFFLAFYFIKEETPSLIVAALSGIIPIFFDNTVNNASIYSAVIPVFFLTIYFFIMTYRETKYVWSLLFSMVLLTFLHPSSLILVFCLLIYILLINVENFRKSFRETEIVMFFMFFVFWANITIYKRALLAHGDMILFQNIPSDILSGSFRELTFLSSIYSIGIIPIIFGLFAIYAALFVSNSKAMMLLTSVSLGSFILLWFKLIDFNTGLMFLSISLIILASYSIGRAYEHMQMIKLKNGHIYFLSIIMIVGLALFIPGVFSSEHNSPSSRDMAAFAWLKNSTANDSVVLALPEEGSALSYFSHRKNVMDDKYLMIKNVDVRYNDVIDVYNDKFMTTALERLNYYSVDYILLSEYNQRKNNISSLSFLDKSCFKQVYPPKGFLESELSEFIDENGSENMTLEEENVQNEIYPKIYRVDCELLSKSKSGNIRR